MARGGEEEEASALGLALADMLMGVSSGELEEGEEPDEDLADIVGTFSRVRGDDKVSQSASGVTEGDVA